MEPDDLMHYAPILSPYWLVVVLVDLLSGNKHIKKFRKDLDGR